MDVRGGNKDPFGRNPQRRPNPLSRGLDVTICQVDVVDRENERRRDAVRQSQTLGFQRSIHTNRQTLLEVARHIRTDRRSDVHP